MGENPIMTVGPASLLWGALQYVVTMIEDRIVEGATAWAALVLFITVVAPGLTQGAVIAAVTASAEGRLAGIGECMTRSAEVAIPLLILTIFAGAGITLGLLAFVVPGIMLLLIWSVAGPARALEPKIGIFAAFERSRKLTRGARWKILAIWLIVVALWFALFALTIILVALAGAAGFATEDGDPAALICIGIFVGMVTAVTATTQAALYLELRGEGTTPQNEGLADIFA